MSINKPIMYIVIISVGIITSSFSNCFIKVSNEDKAIVIVKTKYSTSASTGFGGLLYIRNIETKTVYQGQSNFGYNPFIIIENVPTGNYIIEELQILTGIRPNHSLRFNTKTLAYDTLKIISPKIYYLGSYLSFKTKPLLADRYKIIKQNNDSEKKIHKQVYKRLGNDSNFEIDYSQKLFNSDTTIVEFK